MDDLEMIHRLKTYKNGVHGDFFMEVAARLTSLITDKEPSAQSPAAMAGSVRWKSFARWPHSDDTHMTVDKHDTKEQAEAVCKRLGEEGWGGEGKIFPIKTWVEEIR